MLPSPVVATMVVGAVSVMLAGCGVPIVPVNTDGITSKYENICIHLLNYFMFRETTALLLCMYLVDLINTV